MFDMRLIWKQQLKHVKAIADDIIQNNASPEICRHADMYATVESPYGTDGGYYGNPFIRVNYGEAYCYINIDKQGNVKGKPWWNNEDMGIDGNNCMTYEGSMNALDKMSIEYAYNHADTSCYEYCDIDSSVYELDYETMDSFLKMN